MIIRANKDQDKLNDALDKLELTEKNRQLAEKYLDLSEAERPELLDEAERQDFSELKMDVHYDLYYHFLEPMKKRNEELAGRFLRLIVKIGGTTAQDTVSYYGYSMDFRFAEQFLTPIQIGAVRAEYICRSYRSLKESEFRFLIETGRKDPGALLQMIELCYDKDAANVEMFLSAIYLHCVRPVEDGKSKVCLPVGDHDPRAEADPEKVRERTAYLERRLIVNLDLLFKKADKPEGETFKALQDFVEHTDPQEPFPVEIRAILSGRERYDYQMKFLPSLAFLAIEHSDRFINVIRLAAAIDGDTIPNLPIDSCRDMGDTWFHSHIEPLEPYLPIPEEAYIRWAIWRKEKEVLVRMAGKAGDTIRQVVKKVPTEDYGYLVARLEEGNPRLYEELKEHLTEDYRRLAAHEITEKFNPEQNKAERYVLGELEIGDILPYVKEWRDLYIYNYQRDRQIHGYLEYGLDELVRRTLVLECLRLDDGYFRLYWLDPELEQTEKGSDYRRVFDPRQLGAILDLMEAEQVPPLLQMDAAAHIHMGNSCAEVVAGRHPDWKEVYEEAAGSSLAPTRILALRTMNVLGEAYKETLLVCASESTKQVREHLLEIYAGHKEWEADILDMLKSRKAAAREMAVQILEKWGAEQYQEALQSLLETEKSKKVKDQIQKVLKLEGQTAGDQTKEDLVREILSGGRKRKLSWFLSDERRKVHKLDGEEAPEDLLAAVLVSYADMQDLGISKNAEKLAAELHTGELADYVRELYDLWIAEGAPAKKKWVIYAASIHGGEKIVPVLYAQIQDWAKNSRGAMASEAVRALALGGTSTALLLVDQIARKFRFRQVKDAAGRALSYAAEQLGITKAELEDRIVPDLGFDERMEQTIDYGNRQFRVQLTPELTLEVYDGKGKKLKNLPSPGKQDDPERAKAAYEAWKLLKKQMKTVAANQTLRLEQALGSGRQWKTEQWTALFVKNPIMHQFAAGLIWGVYADGKVEQMFRYMEDGSFNTVDEEEYELPEEGIIGLVHPLELSEEQLTAWKEQLSDYEIVQPVEQLERPVYRVTEEEQELEELSRFHGRVLNGLSLSGKLLNMGWYRGEILDGGGYYDFRKVDQDVEAVLSFSGCSVGYENEEVTVYELSFQKPGTRRKVGNVYENERYRLGEVDPRLFSETLLQVVKATASAK